ncbi:unnamed protein product [Aphanomyces euteiches]|uniref:Uncharacterized protein n=2 Tax=Aphanomyces euteiches TaxID=100861 RepID=A0A6G0X6A4_9STRA|nr:hypothetical protein Ae201684_008089 [Aphanomyces euteiches]KAH9074482.1 hypothetical protein Ae201684P_022289 [Aphanomyces euteiches]KAH9156007.1 hypothetical protein AeRB84_002071 [Aphanomyces euteiches]
MCAEAVSVRLRAAQVLTMARLSKTSMKQYFLKKIFGFHTNDGQRSPYSEWEFYPDDNSHKPLPEGLVLDSPECGAPMFHSPTPPSPPGRVQRSVSLDTEKTSATWGSIHQTFKRRLSWIRSTVSKFDETPKTDNQDDVDDEPCIERVFTPRDPAANNSSFLESIAEEDVDDIDFDDVSPRVTFCDTSVIEFESMETLDELVVRVSGGFAPQDVRPAHAKLLGFCTKSLTYLKYRGSPCAEVFALSSSDISMWRRLGHHNWTTDECNHCDDDETSCKDQRNSSESTASEGSDLSDEETKERRIAAVHGDVRALTDVMNSVLSKGDECFSVDDIEHLTKSADYPVGDDDDGVDDDGWC